MLGSGPLHSSGLLYVCILAVGALERADKLASWASQLPQEDLDARELKKAEKVLGLGLPPGRNPATVQKPRKQPLDLPAALVPRQLALVVTLAIASRPVRGDQVDAALGGE